MIHDCLGPGQRLFKRCASNSPTCWYFEGLSGLLFIGLEGVHKLEELQELEFGRGFLYNQPLSITLQSLPSILLKQLVSIFPFLTPSFARFIHPNNLKNQREFCLF